MHAVIVGGGVAGTAAALALHRAGHTSEIHEARPRDADGVGAFLTLAVNGVAALRDLGIHDLTGIPTPRMSLRLGDGTVLTEFPMGDGTLTVRRGDLYRTLRRAAEGAGTAISYDRRLVGLDADAGRAAFADGHVAHGDLLVGADGIGSRVRTLLDPRARRPRYLGLLNTGGFASGVEVPSPPGVMQMMFGRDTFFSWLNAGDGEVWWFANPAQRREPDRAALSATDAEQWRGRLLELVHRDDPVASRVLRAATDILPPWPMHDLPRVPVWHRGTAILLGDAAHAVSPSSGQGASLAVEDALALAELLGDGRDLPRALGRFEALRRPRVQKIIALGKRSSAGKAPGPFRPLRDAMVKAYFSRTRPEVDNAWLWDYRVSEAVAAL